MTAPLVTVVMGTWNGLPYVEMALQSVLEQRGVEAEVVVVDDGSDDATGDLLQSLELKDRRLKWVRQENQGLTRALVVGCGLAQGRYIARQDADDLSLPGRLLAQTELLERDRRIALVSCSGAAIGPAGELLFEDHRQLDPDEATRQLLELRRGPVAHGSAMFRREDYLEVGGYRTQFRFAQDWDLWFRLVERGLFAFAPGVLYALRYREGAITENSRARQEALYRISQECHRRRAAGLAEDVCLEEASRLSNAPNGSDGAWRQDASYFIGRCLLAQRDRRAVEYLARSLRRHPIRGKNLLAYLAAVVVARRPGQTVGHGSQ